MPIETVADRLAIIPKTNANRPGDPLAKSKPEYITVHETANTASGANAEMHRKFVLAGGGKEGVSFHYTVDDKESIQLLPDNEKAWHAGDGPDGPGNSRSVAIEVCVNQDGVWSKTLENTEGLVSRLMQRYEIPIENVVQHNHWHSALYPQGKDCPHKMRATAGWWAFIEAVERKNAPTSRYFPETNLTVTGGFLKLWDFAIDGFPLTSEEREDDLIVQFFENTRMEWKPGQPARRGALGRIYLRQISRMR